MRFIENGPIIPNRMLLARDEGRVIFFCGAGVSRAFAHLHDFFSLATKVTTSLGVAPDSAAVKLLEEARSIEARIGVGGLISADRVFGLLEKDFDVPAIEAAVARALAPRPGVDLTGHKILIDLATTEAGAVQLVTTNFDRLFDECRPGMSSWQPPRFPNLSRAGEFNGVVYLHGKANASYTGAEGDGFILSSGTFGRAYLADGWATQFVKSVLEKYVVVFIGYSADDPPVHYLLEALNRTSNSLDGVYAFQPGNAEDAAARWIQRGVEAIAYDPEGGHRYLWKSLEAWAERARNPTKWFRNVIKRAQAGPESLMPFERGQFAHVVSTQHGAKMVAELDQPPPAEWFCTLDPFRRFGKPGYVGRYPERGPFLDPFDRFGLDDDLAPAAIAPDDHWTKREVPAGSWDGLALNASDRSNLTLDQMTSVRGHWSANVPRLPSRLWFLSVWLSKVADQPAAAWWAAHQNGLHPDLCDLITRQLSRKSSESLASVRLAWEYLFEAWQGASNESRMDWFALLERVGKDGWNQSVLRQMASLTRPYLKAGPVCMRPIPPNKDEDPIVSALVDLDVVYPSRSPDITVPDDWLSRALAEDRKNLEVSVALEEEVKFGFKLDRLAPINASDDPEVDGYDRTHGISAAVIRHASNTTRLSEFDAAGAMREVLNWSGLDGTPFERLRLWAAGEAKLTALATAQEIFSSVDREIFWDSAHARDFLLALAARWNELGSPTTGIVERQLLEGPAQWKGEEDDRYLARRAWSVLNRMHWLSSNGCALSFDLDAETERLRVLAPDWGEQAVSGVTRSMESRGGWVKTDSDYNALLAIPLGEVLSKVEQIEGRRVAALVEQKPFVGLSAARPVRALMVLKRAAQNENYPEWAWRTFLGHEARQKDRPRLARAIGHEVLALPANVQVDLAGDIGEWIGKVSGSVAKSDVALWDRLIDICVQSFALDPKYQRSNIIRKNGEVEWVIDAINSAPGRLAQTLILDPRVAKTRSGKTFPKRWLQYVEALLELPNDAGRLALVLFARRSSWFLWIDPEWTEAHLFSRLSSAEAADKDAFWSGLLFARQTPSDLLYRRLKPELLNLPKLSVSAQRDSGQTAAAILLVGWASSDPQTGEPYVSSDELRTVLVETDDSFRSHILWTIQRWASEKLPKGASDWPKLQIDLLKTVWPKQRSARSGRISARLLDLVFASAKHFQALAEVVLPLLTIIDNEHITIPALYRDKNNFGSKFPRETLAMLAAVLPENPSAWPYGIEATFVRIQKADARLASDPRLLELLRRWDGR